MKTSGMMLERVNLWDWIFWMVLRGSRDRSSRWSAAVMWRRRGVRRCVGRWSTRVRRTRGDRIIRGTVGDGPDDVRLDIAGRVDIVSV
jgi:hypothetical protein